MGVVIEIRRPRSEVGIVAVVLEFCDGGLLDPLVAEGGGGGGGGGGGEVGV